jgi:hypothetical protein
VYPDNPTKGQGAKARPLSTCTALSWGGIILIKMLLGVLFMALGYAKAQLYGIDVLSFVFIATGGYSFLRGIYAE